MPAQRGVRAEQASLFKEPDALRTCWQIRQAFLDQADQNAGDGWLLACDDCPVPGSGLPCWEQADGISCCAPVHITCDFCSLYIEHRREIAGLPQPDAEYPHPVSSPLRKHPQGGTPVMEKIQLSLPNMWADHHVLTVRAALLVMPGVQEVIASSAFRMVALSYDPTVTTPGGIMAALEDAGYPVATDGSGVIAESVPVATGKRDPAWTRLGMRQIKTDERDLKTKR